MDTKIRDTLAELAGTRRWVQLHRRFPGYAICIAVVHDVSDDLVLIQQYNDFHNDGFAIFRVEDIVSIRCNEADRFWTKMMIQEGRLEELRVPFPVKLDDMRTCLASICNCKRCVVLECEDPEDESNDRYSIGRLLTVGRDSVMILPFDIRGRWSGWPVEIGIDALTCVQFETPYIKIFSKYAR